jgi:hypothetical protein
MASIREIPERDVPKHLKPIIFIDLSDIQIIAVTLIYDNKGSIAKWININS